jgi:acyl-CoA synthetase (AMP-forming)/AMP-acid ligase II
MLAGMAISTAAPSGIFGMLKEGMASTSAVLHAGQDPHANGLVKAVAAEFQSSEGRTQAREAIQAVVVLHEKSRISEDELLDWCRGRMAGYKRPQAVRFIADSEMPRTATGKILHRALRDRLGVSVAQR